MSNVMKSFICRGCWSPVISTGCTNVNIGVSANLELVDKFHYLGVMLNVDGDANATVEASCVQSSMLHGSETRPVRKENEVALQRAEMRMVR